MSEVQLTTNDAKVSAYRHAHNTEELEDVLQLIDPGEISLSVYTDFVMRIVDSYPSAGVNSLELENDRQDAITQLRALSLNIANLLEHKLKANFDEVDMESYPTGGNRQCNLRLYQTMRSIVRKVGSSEVMDISIIIVNKYDADANKFEWEYESLGNIQREVIYSGGWLWCNDEFACIGECSGVFHVDTQRDDYAVCEVSDLYYHQNDLVWLDHEEYYVHPSHCETVHCEGWGFTIRYDDSVECIDRRGDNVFVHQDYADEHCIYTDDNTYINEEAAEYNDCWYDDHSGQWREENDRPANRYFDNYFSSYSMRNKKRSLSPAAYTALEHSLGMKSITNRQFNGLKYTFGVEIETDSIDQPLDPEKYTLNLAAVSDGSVNGPEFVTGCLTGDAGLKQLEQICIHLNDANAYVNSKCGVHVHIGGAQFNRRFQMLAIMLAMQIQDEMYAMQPSSRKSSSYCKPIPEKYLSFKNCFSNDKSNRKRALKLLHEYVTGNQSREFNKDRNKKLNHPNGHYCSSRYKWLNLNNCSFNDGPETVEFRLQSGSTDYIKIKYFIQICMAFVNFVENKSRRICLGFNHHYDYAKRNTMALGNSVSLREILEYSYTPEQCKELTQYITKRIEKFNS